MSLESVSINRLTAAKVSATSPLLPLTLLVYLCPLAKLPNNSTITVVSLWLKKSSLALAGIDHLTGTGHFLFPFPFLKIHILSEFQPILVLMKVKD